MAVGDLRREPDRNGDPGAAAGLRRALPARTTLLRPFLAAGFCGALTTFSTLQVELIRLGQHGHAGLAAAYLAASLGGGLLLAATGWHALTPVRRRVTDT